MITEPLDFKTTATETLLLLLGEVEEALEENRGERLRTYQNEEAVIELRSFYNQIVKELVGRDVPLDAQVL